MPRQDYYKKQEVRRERLEAAAEKARARAAAAYKRADMSESATGIPFGQPILVGHHSEGRHRAAIKRADNAMRKSIKEDRLAASLESKAASAGLAGISSDAPDAIELLEQKLADLVAKQEMMKAANKAIKKGDDEALTAALPGDDWTPEKLAMFKTPDFLGRVGFAGFQLTNNNAKISATRKRVEQLKREAKRDYAEVETNLGFKLVQNVEANRVQILFDVKPSAETRSVLKSRGFRWAPSEGAWQRMLNHAGVYAAKQVVRELTPEGE